MNRRHGLIGLIGLMFALSGWCTPLAQGANPALDKVIIVAEGGPSGMIFPPYLLFKDGNILRRAQEAPSDIDVARSKRERPNNWGRYRLEGGDIQVTWGDGTKDTYFAWGSKTAKSGRQWATVLPADKGDQLSGHYFTMTGNTGSAYSPLVMLSSDYYFNKDGSFSNERVAAVSSTSPPDGPQRVEITGSSSDKVSGRYRLDGYTIELKGADGKVHRLLFFYFPDGKGKKSVGGIGIGTRNFAIRD